MAKFRSLLAKWFQRSQSPFKLSHRVNGKKSKALVCNTTDKQFPYAENYRAVRTNNFRRAPNVQAARFGRYLFELVPTSTSKWICSRGSE